MAEPMVVTVMVDDIKDANDTIDLVGAADREERQLAQVIAVLTTEFPDVPNEVIVGLTRHVAERYKSATVRTFLPILLPKDVRELLSSGAYESQVPAQGTSASSGGSVLQLAVGPST
jgi:hypothetical protein